MLQRISGFTFNPPSFHCVIATISPPGNQNQLLQPMQCWAGSLHNFQFAETIIVYSARIAPNTTLRYEYF